MIEVVMFGGKVKLHFTVEEAQRELLRKQHAFGPGVRRRLEEGLRAFMVNHKPRDIRPSTAQVPAPMIFIPSRRP